MKKLILIYLIFLSSVSFGQKLPIIDNKYNFTQIINLDSTNKSEIYSQLKICISKIYKNPQKVTILDDRESGRVILKPIIYSWMSGTIHNVYCTTNFYIKDNKLKLEITDFLVDDGHSINSLENWNTNPRKLSLCLQSVYSSTNNFIDKFKIEISKNNKDNW
jgi:hypothetical protein